MEAVEADLVDDKLIRSGRKALNIFKVQVPLTQCPSSFSRGKARWRIPASA
jgi:hypothetical protein